MCPTLTQSQLFRLSFPYSQHFIFVHILYVFQLCLSLVWAFWVNKVCVNQDELWVKFGLFEALNQLYNTDETCSLHGSCSLVPSPDLTRCHLICSIYPKILMLRPFSVPSSIILLVICLLLISLPFVISSSLNLFYYLCQYTLSLFLCQWSGSIDFSISLWSLYYVWSWLTTLVYITNNVYLYLYS